MTRTPSGWHIQKISDFEASVQETKPGTILVSILGQPTKVFTRSDLYAMLSLSEQVESAERQRETEKKKGKKGKKNKPVTFKGISGEYV